MFVNLRPFPSPPSPALPPAPLPAPRLAAFPSCPFLALGRGLSPGLSVQFVSASGLEGGYGRCSAGSRTRGKTVQTSSALFMSVPVVLVQALQGEYGDQRHDGRTHKSASVKFHSICSFHEFCQTAQ